MKELVTTITLDDCEVQTFRAGGKGGQNQNKRDTGVRIIHRASGARAESRNGRTQLENKRSAFVKMTRQPEFIAWVRRQSGEDAKVAASVDQAMWPVNIKMEFKRDGEWVTE